MIFRNAELGFFPFLYSGLVLLSCRDLPCRNPSALFNDFRAL